jgi:hypothetical protein
MGADPKLLENNEKVQWFGVSAMTGDAVDQPFLWITNNL